MVEHTAVNRGVVGSNPTRGVCSKMSIPTLSVLLLKLEERKKTQDLSGFNRNMGIIRREYNNYMDKEIDINLLNKIIRKEKRISVKCLFEELKEYY